MIKTKKKKIELTNQNTQQEISATYIYNFFSNIGPNLAKYFDQEWIYEGNVSDTHLDNIITDIDEVRDICKGIDVNKRHV